MKKMNTADMRTINGGAYDLYCQHCGTRKICKNWATASAFYARHYHWTGKYVVAYNAAWFGY